MHDEAARAEETDWPQILALYELLKRMSDNPMVMLNHAIAAAMVHGPSKGLELLDALDADGRLAGHHRLDAVRVAIARRGLASTPIRRPRGRVADGAAATGADRAEWAAWRRSSARARLVATGSVGSTAGRVPDRVDVVASVDGFASRRTSIDAQERDPAA